MKKKNSGLVKLTLLIAFISIFAFSPHVEAAEDTVMNKTICLSNRKLYNVSWSVTKNSAVKEELIDETAIQNGYVTFPIGTSETDMIKYKINPVLLADNCYMENGEIKTCPTNSELSAYNISRIIEINDDNEYTNMIMDFNPSTGMFTVKILDLYNGKVKIRLVGSGQEENDGTKLATSYNNFLGKQGNYYVINNVQPSRSYQKSDGTWDIYNSTLILEFYINDSSSRCNNSYIASLNLVMDTADDIQVDNPALTDASYGCQAVKDYINKLLASGIVANNSGIEKVLKYNYSSLCFTNHISYQDYLNLKDNISKQFSDLQTLLGHGADSAISSIGVKGNATCEQNYTEGNRAIIAESGKWWNLYCEESYSVTGDKAKLVFAGAGFSYVSNFTATRTCTLQQNAVVVLKPQCVYKCETVCTYSTDNGTVTDNKGGPNEDFDACVTACDGGKYSQNCINSCYQQVYSQNNNMRELPTLSSDSKNASFLEDGYEIQRTSVVGEVTSSAGGTFTHMSEDAKGNPKAMYRVDVPTEHCGNVGVTFSSYCDAHDGHCTIFETKGPGGCVDNPQALYAQELNESISEFQSMISIMQKEIATGAYTIKIADSYLNNGETAYTYEISSSDNGSIVSASDGGGYCNSQTWTFGSQGETGTFCSKNQKSKQVTVVLPKAYLDKKTGIAIYENGSNRYASFNASTPSTKLESVSFNSRSVYPGGQKYYTNILSDNVNVVIGEKTVTLSSYSSYFARANKKANIAVSVDGLGTNGDYSNQINCFYGVYNNTVCKGDDCSECPGCPDPGGGGGELLGEGITIIFRPIDLNDNFPNDRNPRWNWTDKASVTDTNSIQYSLLNYKVLPSELNKQIEEKGYNIYTDTAEVDYDIILTPENLRNIKQYNKRVEDFNKDGSNNYLDYDMTCGTRKNREYCYSNFLDNTNYVTYNTGFNATGRKDIAICNNTYNGQCTN